LSGRVDSNSWVGYGVRKEKTGDKRGKISILIQEVLVEVVEEQPSTSPKLFSLELLYPVKVRWFLDCGSPYVYIAKKCVRN